MVLLHEIKVRRSRKAFLQKKVTEDILKELLRAAQLSPSCFNKQPARFIAVMGEKLDQLHQALTEGNSWAMKAPVLMAVVSKPELGCRSKGREYYLFSSGLALENLILQAVHLGLFAHPMIGFEEDKAKGILGIPDDYRVLVLVAIGYPDPNEVLEEKDRKSFDEVAFHQTWENPFGK